FLLDPGFIRSIADSISTSKIPFSSIKLADSGSIGTSGLDIFPSDELLDLGTFNKGGLVKFATGGHVPGRGNRDTVPALLTPGEFVINKQSAEALGPEKLNRLNKYAKGGPVQKFQTGGSVQGLGRLGDLADNIDRLAISIGQSFI